MPRVSVWKCPKTGNLFESTMAYKEHLRAHAASNFRSRKVARDRALVAAKFAEMRRLLSLDEIAEWIVQNGEYFFLNEQLAWGHLIEEIDLTGCSIRSVEFARVKYRLDASLSHCAPIGMRTNWCGQDKYRPIHMPGFDAVMRVVYTRGPDASLMRSKEKPKPYSPDFKQTGIGTRGGSGGGRGDGTSTMQWDATLFSQDFVQMTTLMALKDQINVV